MSRQVELHVLLELAPESWSSALFDVPPRALPGGIVPAEPTLRECLPPQLHRHWSDLASFNFIVHRSRRALHPLTLATSHRAARFVQSLRPDLVHVDNWSLRMSLALWEWHRLPLVLTMHDPEPHSGEGNWRRDLTCRLTFPFVDRYILFNEIWVEPFISTLGIPRERVTTMPLGVHGMSGAWAHEVVPEEERTVLFFGRLSVYKGLDVLYAAAPLVAERVPGVRFIVAGRPERYYTPPRPPSLPNGGVIELHERYITNAETSQLFERAAVVACPNLDATQSGVVLTAFGFGKPVVATRVGGIPEYVDDEGTGLLVQPGAPVEFAEALVRILEDASLRERMKAEVARQRDTRFSWSTFVSNMHGAYERTLAGARQGKR